jgi:hypothetical protein
MAKNHSNLNYTSLNDENAGTGMPKATNIFAKPWPPNFDYVETYTPQNPNRKNIMGKSSTKPSVNNTGKKAEPITPATNTHVSKPKPSLKPQRLSFGDNDTVMTANDDVTISPAGTPMQDISNLFSAGNAGQKAEPAKKLLSLQKPSKSKSTTPANSPIIVTTKDNDTVMTSDDDVAITQVVTPLQNTYNFFSDGSASQTTKSAKPKLSLQKKSTGSKKPTPPADSSDIMIIQDSTTSSLDKTNLDKKRKADEADLPSIDTNTKKPKLSPKKKSTSEKKTIEKFEILRFLKSITDVDLSKDVLTEIVYEEDGKGTFIVVGRPPVDGSSTKQMRHVTPFSFISKIILHMVKSASSAKDLFNALSYAILPFLSKGKGFCFNQKDLSSSPYKDIKQKIDASKMIQKSLVANDDVFLFVPGAYKEKLFNTPTKMDKAIKEHDIRNKDFVLTSLAKLSKAIEDSNTATIASEALARYMFILFNQQKYTAFPEEGNTLHYEIRLYNSPEEAAAPKNHKYEVMTSREIKIMIDKGHADKITECIRIVNCEGARNKEICKGLVNLDNIIKEYNLLGEIAESATIKSLLEIFNQKYNFYLKLANVAPDLSKYNDNLRLDSYKETIAHQAAKLLYYVFDFKALEDNVFVPQISKDSIKVYNSATGTKTSKYSIQDGQTYRKAQKNEATGYNDEVTFRTSKTKLDILAQKAVEHIYISLMPFDGFHEGCMTISLLKPIVPNKKDNGFIKVILNSFANLIKLDYALSEDQRITFDKLVIEDFSKITDLETSIETDNNYKVNITGENYNFLNF